MQIIANAKITPCHILFGINPSSFFLLAVNKSINFTLEIVQTIPISEFLVVLIKVVSLHLNYSMQVEIE